MHRVKMKMVLELTMRKLFCENTKKEFNRKLEVKLSVLELS